MALKVNVTTESGVSFDQSYARIDSIGGSKDSLQFTLNYYVGQQEFLEGKGYLKQERYEFEPSVEDDAPNFIKQGYEHLKALPDFAQATDA